MEIGTAADRISNPSSWYVQATSLPATRREAAHQGGREEATTAVSAEGRHGHIYYLCSVKRNQLSNALRQVDRTHEHSDHRGEKLHYFGKGVGNAKKEWLLMYNSCQLHHTPFLAKNLLYIQGGSDKSGILIV